MNYPILGKPWHFYCDESGDRNPISKDNCLCFAIIGIPGHIDEKICDKIIKSCHTKTSKPFFKEILNRLKNYQAITTITHFDLSDNQTANRIIERHSTGMSGSKLPLKKQASISNYVWQIAYGLSLFNAICNVCDEKGRVNNVFVKYHNFPLKSREKAIFVNFQQWMTERIKDINMKLKDYAKYDYWKAEDLYVSDISEASEELVQIRVAHHIVKLFRKFYKQSTISQFDNELKEGNVHIKDLTHQFREWKLQPNSTW